VKHCERLEFWPLTGFVPKSVSAWQIEPHKGLRATAALFAKLAAEYQPKHWQLLLR
jgi:hypothetical protein